eukprot:TRINITY_DN197_c5_g1_i1.p1 TRINITY_DN197_c5_g1~~TRINITY_DN197_c5_g1_i1.p1  ORF type:complete len:1011 (-),score=412.30 TRINITY_DN197_c5_g1_i1:146-3178(-)
MNALQSLLISQNVDRNEIESMLKKARVNYAEKNNLDSHYAMRRSTPKNRPQKSFQSPTVASVQRKKQTLKTKEEKQPTVSASELTKVLLGELSRRLNMINSPQASPKSQRPEWQSSTTIPKRTAQRTTQRTPKRKTETKRSVSPVKTRFSESLHTPRNNAPNTPRYMQSTQAQPGVGHIRSPVRQQSPEPKRILKKRSKSTLRRRKRAVTPLAERRGLASTNIPVRSPVASHLRNPRSKSNIRKRRTEGAFSTPKGSSTPKPTLKLPQRRDSAVKTLLSSVEVIASQGDGKTKAELARDLIAHLQENVLSPLGSEAPKTAPVLPERPTSQIETSSNANTPSNADIVENMETATVLTELGSFLTAVPRRPVTPPRPGPPSQKRSSRVSFKEEEIDLISEKEKLEKESYEREDQEEEQQQQLEEQEDEELNSEDVIHQEEKQVIEEKEFDNDKEEAEEHNDKSSLLKIEELEVSKSPTQTSPLPGESVQQEQLSPQPVTTLGNQMGLTTEEDVPSDELVSELLNILDFNHPSPEKKEQVIVRLDDEEAPIKEGVKDSGAENDGKQESQSNEDSEGEEEEEIEETKSEIEKPLLPIPNLPSQKNKKDIQIDTSFETAEIKSVTSENENEVDTPDSFNGALDKMTVELCATQQMLTSKTQELDTQQQQLQQLSVMAESLLKMFQKNPEKTNPDNTVELKTLTARLQALVRGHDPLDEDRQKLENLLIDVSSGTLSPGRALRDMFYDDSEKGEKRQRTRRRSSTHFETDSVIMTNISSRFDSLKSNGNSSSKIPASVCSQDNGTIYSTDNATIGTRRSRPSHIRNTSANSINDSLSLMALASAGDFPSGETVGSLGSFQGYHQEESIDNNDDTIMNDVMERMRALGRVTNALENDLEEQSENNLDENSVEIDQDDHTQMTYQYAEEDSVFAMPPQHALSDQMSVKGSIPRKSLKEQNSEMDHQTEAEPASLAESVMKVRSLSEWLMKQVQENRPQLETAGLLPQGTNLDSLPSFL